MNSKLTDQDLIASIQDGNEHQFAVLWEKYDPAVQQFAVRYLSLSPVDADDLASETFTRALMNMKRFTYRGPNSFRNFLLTIAKRIAVDSWRSRRQGFSFDDGNHFYLIDNEPGPPRNVSSKEWGRIVSDALDRLTGNRRKVAYCYIRDGMSPGEIAAQVGVSARRIRQILELVLENLRKELQISAFEFAEYSRFTSELLGEGGGDWLVFQFICNSDLSYLSHLREIIEEVVYLHDWVDEPRIPHFKTHSVYGPIFMVPNSPRGTKTADHLNTIIQLFAKLRKPKKQGRGSGKKKESSQREQVMGQDDCLWDLETDDSQLAPSFPESDLIGLPPQGRPKTVAASLQRLLQHELDFSEPRIPQTCGPTNL